MKGSFFRDAIFIILAAAAIGLIYNNFAAEPISLWREKAEIVEVSDDELLEKLGSPTNQNDQSGQSEVSAAESTDSQEKMLSPKGAGPESQDAGASAAAQGSQPQAKSTQSATPKPAAAGDQPAKQQAPNHQPVESKTQQVQAKPETTPQQDETFAADHSGPIKNLKYDQVVKMVDNERVQFIDARKADEYQEGFIGNAVNIFTPEHEEHLPTMLAWPRDKLYVVYCGGGNCDLSNELAEIMMAFGFESVYVYKGGYTEWTSKQGK